MTRVIEVTVSPDGSMNIATHGFVGSSCKDASRFIEDALGKKSGETLTPEFYETANQDEVGESHRLSEM